MRRSMQPKEKAPPPSPQDGIPANRLKDLEAPFEAHPSLSPIEDPNPNLAVPEIYDELGPETGSSVNEARGGCMAIFAVAFLALIALVVWVYIKY
ncbi:hypothetical protein [Candidatus Pelagisphaera phototrophica]|uniref:hypothetical protein n=1 Tax=Candidatus Pelagisphaera phototrophica TaxID=2684113 RepID=UPI0019DEA7DF|nr:hypothetical protein [Candidatus Pelagisphaera phototrophica]QXD31125.1 hypothetical protein GA004_12355 [Candidatus Pelagisphaera phototrophica]